MSTFLVTTDNVPGADRTPFAADEYRRMVELFDDGTFAELYVRTDGFGAVAICVAPDREALADRLAQLPFVTGGCVRVASIVELRPRSRQDVAEAAAAASASPG